MGHNITDTQMAHRMVSISDFLCHKMRYYQILGYSKEQAAKIAVDEFKRKRPVK